MMTMVEQFNVLASLAKKVSDAELSVEMQDTIFKAQGLAMELQDRNYVLQSDNTKLKDEIAKLQKIDDMEKDHELIKGVYVSKSTGNTFCGACWATSKVLVPVIQFAGHTSTGICTYRKCQARYPDLFPTKDTPSGGPLERS